MEFIRFIVAGGRPQWGVRDGDRVVSLAGHPDGDPTLAEFASSSYVEKIAEWVGGCPSGVPVNEVRPVAPVPRPGQFIGVGLNYRDHAEEQGADIPERPLFFGKASTSVTNPGNPIVIPPGIEQVDYEVELGVVIGRPTGRVNPEDAWEQIAGYTIVNDVSARDAQFDDRQWYRGKSYDTFGPMGPVLVHRDALDPHALAVSLQVNGEVKQDSTTEQLIFGVDELVAAASEIMTLHPGDVIATGTPGGVGVFRDPPELLEPGDTVIAEIEGIGSLENPVRETDTPERGE